MIWSADQQRMLAAMGYALLRPRATPPATAAAVEQANAAAPAPPTVGFERLQRALQRSAGGSLEGLTLPPLERLRDDPAAKRALWPSLRARRRLHTARP